MSFSYMVGDHMAMTLPALSMRRSIKQTFTRTNRFHELEVRAIRLECYLAAQHAITQIIAQSSELKTALPQILQAICETTNWDFGEVWYVDWHDNHLRCEAT